MHNAEFDIAHLNNELSLAGKGKINKKCYRYIRISQKQISWISK